MNLPRYGRLLTDGIQSFGGMIGSISHVLTDAPIVALTFDDGPHPEYTPRLLEILARYEARATFFMVGKAATEFPHLVEQAAKGGHVIGNHSWDHEAFPFISREQREYQISACSRALAPYESRYFRPPYGEQHLRSYLEMNRRGYQTIGWNVDVGDWCDSDPVRMAEGLSQQIRPGSIVLLHDALFDGGQPTLDRGVMLDAVERLLEKTRRTIRFVTIADLLACGKSRRQGWNKIRATG
jgi:peptidoglycan/xylan/chitin deacetylase (PgdA/CDA1 family)